MAQPLVRRPISKGKEQIMTSPHTASPNVASRTITDRLLQDRVLAHIGRLGLACCRGGLDVTVDNDVAYLRGEVASYHDKQRALSAALRTTGIVSIVDELRVVRPAGCPGMWSRLARWPAKNPIWFRRAAIVTSLAAIVSLVGCGGRGDVPPRVSVYKTTGRVTWNGQPLTGGTVVLHPQGNTTLPNGVRTIGAVDSSGSIVFTTYETGDGAAAGDFTATVSYQPFVGDPEDGNVSSNVLPTEYSVPGSSPLSVTVKPESGNVLELTLTGTGQAPAQASRRSHYDSQ
jgi:hypothetical protein